jgi:hypothetical protein
MTLPLGGHHFLEPGPSGYTYAAVLVRLTGCGAADVLAALRGLRFSGWIAPPERGWLVAVGAAGDGVLAAGRRGVIGVGEWLSDRLGATVLAVRVVDDRQLLLAAWADRAEIGRYVSDPAHGLPADDGTLSEPLGVEHAAAFAAASGRPDAGDDLAEVLAEDLDPDSVIESERLGAVLRLLGLPGWLVAAGSLPRNPPTGPRTRAMTRLGAGVSGWRGRLAGRAVEVVRRRRRPPRAITDAPRGRRDIDPWLM